MTSRLRFHWLPRGLFGLGLLLLAWWSWNYFESRNFQLAESKLFAAALRETEAEAGNAALMSPPASGQSKYRLERGGVLGRLEIPRLGIAAIFAEGSDLKTLKHAIGHVPWTALPGSPGNCGLAGHRDTFLRGLGGIRERDLIRIATLDHTYIYEVEWTKVVAPRRVDVLDPTSVRSLTLVTCYPFDFIGHAPQRFIVRARQLEALTRAHEPPEPDTSANHGGR